MIVDWTFAIVSMSAIGQYELAILYVTQPGFGRTTWWMVLNLVG
jgi:hypothetical protein